MQFKDLLQTELLLKTYSNFTCEQAEQIVVQFKDAQLWENVVSQRAHLEFYHGNF